MDRLSIERDELEALRTRAELEALRTRAEQAERRAAQADSKIGKQKAALVALETRNQKLVEKVAAQWARAEQAERAREATHDHLVDANEECQHWRERHAEVEAQAAAMRGALSLCLRIPPPDPLFSEAVRDLGERVGFGVLMGQSARLWREMLAAKYGDGVSGGAFTVGPCRGTVESALAPDAGRALLAELDEVRAKLDRCVAALEPFALFAERFNARPLRGIGDVVYAIHAEEDGAELRRSDCERALAALTACRKEEDK